MTPRQKELLDYLRDYIDENEYCPSYREMMKHLGLKSVSNIGRLLDCLVTHGKIRRLPNLARSIEIVMPHLFSEKHALIKAKYAKARVKTRFARHSQASKDGWARRKRYAQT